MTLRQELEYAMRWPVTGQTAVQRMAETGDAMSYDEILKTLMIWTGGIRDAVLRLADEIETLKLDSRDA
jgi:hypothetical protein